jgi:hypothetical protein
VSGTADPGGGIASLYGRRRRWLRAIELNVVAWALGLGAFFVTRNAILALFILAVILLGGFVWDTRQAARFIETVRLVRGEHPDWSKDRVFEEAQARRRR